MSPRLSRRELPDPYKVEIVLDSVAPCGARLTTFALTYPRFVHAELMTHRAFSRNSASSRAIPSEKMRDLVKNHPALPIWWGQNQAGMQARAELSNDEALRRTLLVPSAKDVEILVPRNETPLEYVRRRWLEIRDLMIGFSDELADLGKVHKDWTGIGLHKQLANRLTEVWMPITVLVSATSYANWFHLRDHKDAQPEIAVIATEMRYQYLESRPQYLAAGEWHLPYVSLRAPHPRTELGDGRPWNRPEDVDAADALLVRLHSEPDVEDGSAFCAERDLLLKKVSVGRCARVSYLTHEGKRDLEKDIELHDKLAATASSEDPGHFSPFEHVAQALGRPERIGNFTGWKQYRKTFMNEAGPGEVSL